MNRLLVSAAHKSSGKTTLSVGLCAAFAARGVAVQPFKKGPDYIDPMWLGLAAGRPCYNLDPTLMDDAAMERGFLQSLAGAELAVVEGNKGLYDGLALDGSNSNAALARRFGLPVLLVIDARGMTRGIAPLILGYQAFERDIRIGGVILNRVGGSRHEAKLRAVIEHYTDVPVLGAVAEDARLAVVERHLGLVPCAEAGDSQARVQQIGQVIAAQVDLHRVRALGASAGVLPSKRFAPASAAASASRSAASPASTTVPAAPRPADLRIGIARDRAFGFYYPDDLAALRAAGAELVPIDTLHDTRLPDIDGLFIGGGFPETCMHELEANALLRGAIRDALVAGLPAYAECGGLMYLSRSITWQGRSARMVGVIPGDAVMHDRPVGRGYVHLQETALMPWAAAPDGGVAGDAVAEAARDMAGGSVRGHEFHHSSLENLDPGQAFAYRVRRGHGIDGSSDGILVHNLLASYAHLRSEAGSHWAARFTAFVRRQGRRAGALASQAAQDSPPASP